MLQRAPEKISMILLIMILVFSGCSILYISVVTTNALKAQTSSEIQQMAMLAATAVDGDTIAALGPGDEGSAGFLTTRDGLRRMEVSVPEIRSVYVMRRSAGGVEFVVDADYGYVPDAPVIGQPYPEADRAMLAGFFAPSVDDDFVTDEWGTTLSGYSPVRDSSGAVVGIVGVDVDQQTVIEKQNIISWTFYMIVFLAVLMAVFGVIGVEQVRSRLMKDLTDREARYHVLFDETFDAILILINGVYADCNASAGRLLGGEKDRIIGRYAHEFAPETQPDGTLSRDFFAEKTGLALAGEPQRFEWQYRRLDGTCFEAEFSLIRIRMDNTIALQVIVRDVTEKRRSDEALRQSEEKYRTLAEASPDAIYIVGRDMTISYANTLALTLFGWDLSGIRGKRLLTILPEESAEKQAQIIYTVFQHGTVIRRDDRIRTGSGPESWVSSVYTPLKDESGEVAGVLCVSHDITERKAMEDQIGRSLQEKEYLLKEIHHRVKNNLQVISSLLSMQADKTPDENVRQSLMDSQNRVKSIALVHEKLYQSKSLERIEYGDYLNKIVLYLFNTYSIDPSRISCRVNAENIFVDINQAVPCSLIINEMLTNSLKYAFPDGRKGIITIDFKSDENNYILNYRDDGIGIPENISFENSESLGMKLIYGLTQQLGGTVTLHREQGTGYTITFPHIQKTGD